MTKKRWIRIGGLTLALVWSFLILPPVFHTLRGLCPVRPGGIKEAKAVPPFARKLKMNCSECHIAYPKLNAFGRQFKKNGYVKERGSSEGALVIKPIDESRPPKLMEKPFPWGGLVKSRPYENASNSSVKMQPLHELELFIAGGNVSRKFSYFMEIEMESENEELEVTVTHAGGPETVEVDGTRAFQPSIGELQLGYHHNKYLNLLVAHRSFFMMDPYQTITGMGRQTVANRMLAMAAPGSGVALGSEMQTVALYGEVGKEDFGSLYYSVGVQADTSDPEGRGPKDLAGRLAFEIPQGLMVGMFGVKGSQGWQGTRSQSRPTFDYFRGGFDALFEMNDLFVQGAVAWFWDRDRSVSPNTRLTNRAAYIEAGYAYKPEGRDYALIEPIVRLDSWQLGDHTQKFSSLTGQVAHFINENAKVFVEYTTKLSRPLHTAPKSHQDNKWLLEIQIGF